MPSRKFHGKTRTGCIACKARHVKCGEERPLCNNCRRRNTACEYLADNAKQNETSSEASSSMDKAPEIDRFDSLDLVLMHRYSTSTSLHMFPAPESPRIWQVEVPLVAETHAVLQHGMLALAAMDLACVAAARGDGASMAKFRARGLLHQQIALPIFREMLMVNEEDEQKQNVVFLFSAILVIVAFSSALSAKTRPNLEEIINLFVLFRGPRAMWEQHQNGANKELVTALFPKDESVESSLGLLALQSRRNSPGFPIHPDLDEVCAEALSQLRQARTVQRWYPQDVRAMAWFPALVSENFMQQVHEHKPMALKVLLEYVSVLAHFQDRWWISLWHRILSSAIHDVVKAEQLTLPRLSASGPHG
ncbi:hypothetical protein DOTSEDRAFT_72861 [Dothistroma septosporum NZE10]|uniref:Zn(2)-C6 fungal-type domain-containing protein n=1 Tax=Dothistroma septosporum (strain NZE10 / CBS 128990) TaxID=675120 RepID=M2YNN4_DOTSN|nr:hypothetical protein DOTSEDRAFT_72861 [Dothistroma septosporum NZE10]